MYNIVFYGDIKEVTRNIPKTEKVWNEETQVYDTVETVESVTYKYRVPTKFAFNTATSCDKFFANDFVMESFAGNMPSLNSAVLMFTNSAVQTVSGEDETVANFSSVTNADYMFKNCKKLISINIALDSLDKVEGLVDGCTSLESFSGSLSSLKDGTELFYDLPSFTEFDASLNRLVDGTRMFSNSGIVKFGTKLPSLMIGEEMFKNTPIVLFESTLPNIVNANEMFANCSNLTNVKFNSPILKVANNALENTSNLDTLEITAPELISANYMCANSAIKDVKGNLDALKDADGIFINCPLITLEIPSLNSLQTAAEAFVGSQLESWSFDMPNLVNGSKMFNNYQSVEDSYELIVEPTLTSFSADLSSLEDGEKMFAGQTNLTSFCANLSSLNNGKDMFKGCKLDAESFVYIVSSLKPKNIHGVITVGINSESDATSLNEYIQQTNIYSSWAEVMEALSSNSWTLEVYDRNGQIVIFE